MAKVIGFKQKYPIIKDYLPNKSMRRQGTKLSRVGFNVAHDTGNPNSTAKGNINFYRDSAHDEWTSAHIFVDDKEIRECIPILTGVPEKACHVLYSIKLDNQKFGDDANDIACGVECCYGPRMNNHEAYKRFIWVLAYSSYKHGFSPKNTIGHFKLDPKRKVDPMNMLKLVGKSYEQFLNDVVAEYEDCLIYKEEKFVENPNKYFADVPNDHYSSKYFSMLKEKGLLNGREEDGKIVADFGQPLTIERFVTILGRKIEMDNKK